MVIVIKIIVLLIVFIRQFSVTYDIFYNSAILADTKYYVEKLSKSGKRASEGYLKEIAKKNATKLFVELILLYVIIFIIGIF